MLHGFHERPAVRVLGSPGLRVGLVDAALSGAPVEPVEPVTGIALAPALRVEHGQTIGGVIGRF